MIIAEALFALYYAKQNRGVPYWDMGGYWKMSVETSRYVFSHSFIRSLAKLYRSINKDEYNLLLPGIAALPHKIFGYSYHRYILSNCVMFVIPASLVHGLIAVKLSRMAGGKFKDDSLFIAAVCMALILPANYYSAFGGMIDVAYLLPLSVSIYLFLDYDMRKVNAKKDVCIAAMLLLAWLCRRYVIFFIIGYIAAMFVKALCVMIHDKSIKSIKSDVINLFLITAAAMCPLLLLFFKFFARAAFVNYRHIYSVGVRPISESMPNIISAFSPVLLAAIVLIGVLCFIKRKHRVTYAALAVFAVTAALSLSSLQLMHTHHLMILNLPVLALAALPLCLWSGDKAVRSLAAAVCAVFILNFISAFGINIPTVFSRRHYPQYRGDIENMVALVDKLNELTYGTDDAVYLTNDSVINRDILQMVKAPDTFTAVKNKAGWSDVDLWHGFNPIFFDAKYCVVSDAVSKTPLDGVEVARYLSYNVQDSASYIGRHYEKVYEVGLERGATAMIYKRISDFTDSDRQKISDYFMALYPDDKAKFADRILRK